MFPPNVNKITTLQSLKMKYGAGVVRFWRSEYPISVLESRVVLLTRYTPRAPGNFLAANPDDVRER